ncbi:MAG: YkgJ family cysteine cluster protein [Acidobacteriota bacterium]
MSRTYQDILTEADEHFDRVVSEQSEHLLCRKGCSLCCYGLFEISAADVSLIVEAFGRLPGPDRDRLLENARRLAVEPLSGLGPAEKEQFFARTDSVPCPALDEAGACTIYESRPLVCRTFGLPLREGSRFIGDICELNFTEASRDEMERAAWDLEREDVLGTEDEFTIPEAILLAARMLGGHDPHR